MSASALRMLPPPPKPKPEMVNTGLSVPRTLLNKLDKIVAAEGVKSRNILMASMLAFDVELFPHVRRMEEQLREVQEEFGITQVQAIVRLLEQALASRKKK